MEKPWGNHEVTMRFSVQIPGLPEHHWQLNDHTDDSKYDHADDPSACSAINPDLECSPQTTLHAFPSLHTNLSSLICTELSSRVVFPPRTERDTTLLYVSQCCHLPVRSEHHSLLQKRSTVWEIDSHSFTQREMKQLDFSWPSVLAVYTPKHTHTHQTVIFVWIWFCLMKWKMATERNNWTDTSHVSTSFSLKPSYLPASLGRTSKHTWGNLSDVDKEQEVRYIDFQQSPNKIGTERNVDVIKS